MDSITHLLESIGIPTYIIGTVFPLFATVIGKALIRKDFRIFVVNWIKSLFRAILKGTYTTHQLFTNAERYKMMAKKIVFKDDPIKTSLFHIIIETKIDTTVRLLEEWIKLNSGLLRGYSNKTGLRFSFEKLSQDIEDTCEANIRKAYFTYLENRDRAEKFFKLSYEGICEDDCGSNQEGIECINKCARVRGFKEYYDNSTKGIGKFIESLLEYETTPNEHLFSFLLNFIDMALHSTVTDAKETFDNQNGRYKK